MSASYVPTGPEATPSSVTSQPSVASPLSTVTPPFSAPSDTVLPITSIVLIVVFLVLFGLAALAVAVYWRRNRWTTTARIADEQQSEKATVVDVEALVATHSIIPVIPLPDVRWKPQIRSISGPAPGEDVSCKSATLPPLKRARSPPPPYFMKSPSAFPDSFPKSAPAFALSFSRNDTFRPETGTKKHMSLAEPETPRALAVSGLQTRPSGFLKKL